MKLEELRKMSPEQRRHAISELAHASMGPPNGQMDSLNHKLRELEVRYEMSTPEMIEAFRAGRIEDTPEISRWLVLARGRGG